MEGVSIMWNMKISFKEALEHFLDPREEIFRMHFSFNRKAAKGVWQKVVNTLI